MVDLPPILAVPAWPGGASIYPLGLDQFVDDTGPYAKAINDIQKSIQSIQISVGTTPSGDGSTIGMALSLFENGLAALSAAQTEFSASLANLSQIPGPPNTWFHFTQGNPTAIWVINHTMGRYPAVTIVDSAGSVIEGDIHYVSASQLTITFSAPFAGEGYLS